jgi:hypothetical protein
MRGFDALNKTKNTKGATIYVARVNDLGDSMFCRPGAIRSRAIREAGIKEVVYT